MDESYNDDCDVVVIGGGLSGLAAARTLVQHDSSLRVTLLEANSRLGGRVLSVKIQERFLEHSVHRIISKNFRRMRKVKYLTLGLTGLEEARHML